MKLARVAVDGQTKHALMDDGELSLIDDAVLDGSRTKALELLCSSPEALREAAEGGRKLPLVEDQLGAPVEAPGKIIAVGLNYADHIAESGMEAPDVPNVFAKFPSAVTSPFAAVEVPGVSSTLDFEGELAFVIGKACRHVARERAHEVIAGYLVFNDFSVREWQLRSPQWTLGKSFDTHAPMGPWITGGDSFDPEFLSIITTVNGETRQNSNSDQLVFSCAELVEYLSKACTLYPGDVIATGTPSGVGGAENPPRYLEPGDEVTVEIEHLGRITNRIIAEPRPDRIA